MMHKNCEDQFAARRIFENFQLDTRPQMSLQQLQNFLIVVTERRNYLKVFCFRFFAPRKSRYPLERWSLCIQLTGNDSTRLSAIMLGRMASAARLGTSSGADLSSEAADASQAAATAVQGTSGDGPAGGTSAAMAAATSMTTAAQQHPNLIGTIVGKMAKIQREGRGRRYRVSSFGVACMHARRPN